MVSIRSVLLKLQTVKQSGSVFEAPCKNIHILLKLCVGLVLQYTKGNSATQVQYIPNLTIIIQ